MKQNNLPFDGFCKRIPILSAVCIIFLHIYENLSSDFKFSKVVITSIITFLDIPRVAHLFYKVLLKTFMILNTSFNIVSTTINSLFCIELNILETIQKKTYIIGISIYYFYNYYLPITWATSLSACSSTLWFKNLLLLYTYLA